jgi:hypothetical protein
MREYHILELENLDRHPKTLAAFETWLKQAFNAVQRWLEQDEIDESDKDFCTAVVRRASLTASRLGAGHLAEPVHVRHLHVSSMSVLGRMLVWCDGQLNEGVWLSTADVAQKLTVSQDKVLAWIRAGELRATNIATKGSAKPIWKIDPSELQSFALLYSNAGTERARQPKRRKTNRPDEVQFYQ